MGTISTTRHINAPVAEVFRAITDVEHFVDEVPHITDIEFLSETRSGVGTKFRETRVMNGREAKATLEMTEYAENEHVRFVSDEGGTIWDTVMAVHEDGGATRLEMAMDVRPYKLISKIVTPLISGMVTKAIEADMDSLKERCEAKAAG
jgi:carbon monoxide dehydrogenase subunit G